MNAPEVRFSSVLRHDEPVINELPLTVSPAPHNPHIGALDMGVLLQLSGLKKLEAVKPKPGPNFVRPG